MNTKLYAHIRGIGTSTTVTVSTLSTCSTAHVVPITGSKTTILAAHYVSMFLKQHDVPELTSFYLSRCIDYAAAYDSIVHCVEIYESHGKNNPLPISDVVDYVYHWTNDTLTELWRIIAPELVLSGENQK